MNKDYRPSYSEIIESLKYYVSSIEIKKRTSLDKTSNIFSNELLDIFKTLLIEEGFPKLYKKISKKKKETYNYYLFLVLLSIELELFESVVTFSEEKDKLKILKEVTNVIDYLFKKCPSVINSFNDDGSINKIFIDLINDSLENSIVNQTTIKNLCSIINDLINLEIYSTTYKEKMDYYLPVIILVMVNQAKVNKYALFDYFSTLFVKKNTKSKEKKQYLNCLIFAISFIYYLLTKSYDIDEVVRSKIKPHLIGFVYNGEHTFHGLINNVLKDFNFSFYDFYKMFKLLNSNVHIDGFDNNDIFNFYLGYLLCSNNEDYDKAFDLSDINDIDDYDICSNFLNKLKQKFDEKDAKEVLEDVLDKDMIEMYSSSRYNPKLHAKDKALAFSDFINKNKKDRIMDTYRQCEEVLTPKFANKVSDFFNSDLKSKDRYKQNIINYENINGKLEYDFGVNTSKFASIIINKENDLVKLISDSIFEDIEEIIKEYIRNKSSIYILVDANIDKKSNINFLKISNLNDVKIAGEELVVDELGNFSINKEYQDIEPIYKSNKPRRKKVDRNLDYYFNSSINIQLIKPTRIILTARIKEYECDKNPGVYKIGNVLFSQEEFEKIAEIMFLEMEVKYKVNIKLF